MSGFLLDTNIPSELTCPRPSRELPTGWKPPTIPNCF